MNDNQDEYKEPAWIHNRSQFYQEICARQNFHADLHPTVLRNIMVRDTLLLGMPVCDSTFNAVRSGRNLFIQTPGLVRSLQYLLPVAHSILDFGVFERRRMPEHGGQLPLRPLSLLVLCPTRAEAEDVQQLGTRLVRGHLGGMKMTTMYAPDRQLSILRTRGVNVLTSTPEILLQWHALSHTKAFLHELLQDVETLVVDAKTSSLRHGDFIELIGAVMEDIPLRGETQRVIVSDDYDSQLDGPLTRRFLPGGYDVNHEPRLEDIEALRGVRQEKKRKRIRRRNKRIKRWRETLATLKNGRLAKKGKGFRSFDDGK